MNVIATAIIDGPEAKGGAEIVDDSGQMKLRFKEGFWVAPGAPDVTLTFSPNAEGTIDRAMIEVGMYDYNNPSMIIALPNNIDLNTHSTIIVYCKQYTAHFGHGTLLFS